MSKIFREGMEVPQDIDGGSAKPKEIKKSKRKAPKVKIDMPSDPDDGSVGMKHGGTAKGYGMARGGKVCKVM